MIKILTDSTANLPAKVMDEYPSISVIPSYVTFDNETLRETIDLTTADFYKRLVASKELPTSNQASVQDFEAFYRQMLSDDPQTTIISIHLSGTLSGTVGSARQAASRLPDADIHVFDSQSISLGHGLMVRQAAYMTQVGFSIKEILAHLAFMRAHMRVYFVLDTLDYLSKGGRIGVAARVLGAALDVKPILTIQDGAVVPCENHRTRERAIDALRDKILTDGQGKHGLQLAVIHAACEGEAQEFASRLQADLNPDVILIGELGPTVGVYSGPGALGACWWIPEQ